MSSHPSFGVPQPTGRDEYPLMASAVGRSSQPHPVILAWGDDGAIPPPPSRPPPGPQAVAYPAPQPMSGLPVYPPQHYPGVVYPSYSSQPPQGQSLLYEPTEIQHPQASQFTTLSPRRDSTGSRKLSISSTERRSSRTRLDFIIQ